MSLDPIISPFDIIMSLGITASSIICHTFFVSHPLLGTNINTKTKIHHGLNEESTLLHRSLQSLHYPHDLMISVSHTMQFYPHTSGGNLLTQKITHLALHGLNHIHTSYSYHISLTFDLHSGIYNPKHYYFL